MGFSQPYSKRVLVPLWTLLLALALFQLAWNIMLLTGSQVAWHELHTIDNDPNPNPDVYNYALYGLLSCVSLGLVVTLVISIVLFARSNLRCSAFQVQNMLAVVLTATALIVAWMATEKLAGIVFAGQVVLSGVLLGYGDAGQREGVWVGLGNGVDIEMAELRKTTGIV